MRNAEAARYARWAATVSILIVTLTAGVYIRRAWRASHTGGETPEPIPDSVQQRSAVFSHSKVESNRTIYTIRASQATEFKEHSLLQDVWITIYGQEGARNDNVHTRECSYEPNSGNIRCQGVVQIDLESADQAKEPGHPHIMHVKTQDFSFDEKTGDASSDQPVEIQFPGGSGHGRGLTYNANRTDLRLEHDVEFQMGSPTDPKAPVTTFAGSALDFQRSISTAQLFGPVRVNQSGRVLTSGLLTLLLDSEMHARHVRASNHPALHSSDVQPTTTGTIEVTSDEMDADLDPAGWAQQAQFSGNVRAHRRNGKENANFTAQQAVLLMEPRDNLLRSVTANGGVHVDMHSDTPSGPQSRTLDTAALRLDFHSTPGPDPSSQISAAETLAPGAIGLNSPGDTTQVYATKFNAHFDAAGRFDWLEGHSETEINRQIKSDPPQKITARDLAVTFANDGSWTNLKLDRNVRFHQADRSAECDRATIAHATNIIHLDGSPAVADLSARTTAGAIEINQSTNDIHAESSVLTTYRNSTPDKGPDHRRRNRARVLGHPGWQRRFRTLALFRPRPLLARRYHAQRRRDRNYPCAEPHRRPRQRDRRAPAASRPGPSRNYCPRQPEAHPAGHLGRSCAGLALLERHREGPAGGRCECHLHPGRTAFRDSRSVSRTGSPARRQRSAAQSRSHVSSQHRDA